MGLEEMIPLALTLAGTGVGAVNQISANSRAQNSAAQGLLQQQALRQQAAGQVNKTVSQVASSTPKANQQASATDFINQLKANNAAASTAPTGSPAIPGANPRYATTQAANNQVVQNYGNTQAMDLSNMLAAVKQRQQEGLNANTLQANLGVIGAKSAGDSFVNQLRTAAVGQQNPWWSLAGTALKGAGMAAGANFGGADANTLTAQDYANGIVPGPAWQRYALSQ